MKPVNPDADSGETESIISFCLQMEVLTGLWVCMANTLLIHSKLPLLSKVSFTDLYLSITQVSSLMAHTHWTGLGPGQGRAQ